MEALNADAIDATFIGPNPAINLWAKSKGQAIKIVAGTTSGGASLITKPEINGAADLKGKKVASPQLGGTQDVALRSWLLAAGLKTDKSGGGDVAVVPQANADTLDRVQDRRHRRRLGARAVGDPPRAGGRRQGAGRREDAVARAASSSPPTSSSARSS